MQLTQSLAKALTRTPGAASIPAMISTHSGQLTPAMLPTIQETLQPNEIVVLVKDPPGTETPEALNEVLQRNPLLVTHNALYLVSSYELDSDTRVRVDETDVAIITIAQALEMLGVEV